MTAEPLGLLAIIRLKAARCRSMAADAADGRAGDWLAKAREWEALAHEVAAQDENKNPPQLVPIDPRKSRRGK